MAVRLAALDSGVPAQSTSSFFYPIHRVHTEPPAEDVFGIQGYVAWVSVCPPCPRDAVCPPCLPPSIIVSADSREVDDAVRRSSRAISLGTRQLTGFRQGQHYRFLVSRASGVAGSGPCAYELLEFSPTPPANPTLIRVDDRSSVARVGVAVRRQLGRDGAADQLPVGVALDDGFRYLTTKSAVDAVRDALTGIPSVYGLEFETEVEQERLRVFAYATRPDFAGEFVYAVSRPGVGWPVLIHRPPL